MIKFGTGGWREIIGDQFTKENVQKIARRISPTGNEMFSYLKAYILLQFSNKFPDRRSR